MTNQHLHHYAMPPPLLPDRPHHTTTVKRSDATDLQRRTELWQRGLLAAGHLATKMEDPRTIEQIAALQQATAPAGQTDLAARLLHATKQSRQTRKAKRWKTVVDSKEINIRKQFGQLVRG